jgi:NADH dehydrogenase [ubiquinone] 1 alpha subcomplex assembly factor 5
MAHLTATSALRTTLRRPRSQYNISSFTTTAVASSQVVFDTAFKARQRDVLAARQSHLLNVPDLEEAERFDYLRDEIADRLVDRLDDLDHTRRFPKAADVGCWSGHVLRAVERRPHLLSQNTLQDFALYDQSSNMLELTKQKQQFSSGEKTVLNLSYHHLVDCAGGSEDLGLEENSVDLITSNMWLHWCNNLPSILTQLRKALKPDGLFLGSMLGGETLSQLRSSLVLAEQEILGGVSPRISPQVHVGDVGMLLQGAGFNIPTVDTDLVTVEYPSLMSLMKHLQGMGESNASVLRHQGPLRRDVIQVAEREYHARYGNAEDQSVPATYQIIYMIGWSPSEDQMKPLSRGSGLLSLSDLKSELKKPKVIPSGKVEEDG